VAPLRELARERGVEYNIEGNPFHAYLDYARELRPEQCTLVPDAPGASTSDHGWDLARDGERLRPVIEALKSLGIRVSLFMEAEAASMQRAADLGADRVELYTEPYARAHGTAGQGAALARYREAALAATQAGLGLNAGHDLNRANLPDFLAGVPGVREVSIGHALIADALEFGMRQTVHLYLEAIERGRPR
jgi:pyridoxine 5-phosphate synthase